MEKTGFLQENPQEWSIMRLGFLILLIWFMVLTGYITHFDKWNAWTVSFMGTYITILVGGKVWQKKYEK